MDSHTSEDCQCHLSTNISSSVYENLDELEFRRGLWSSAQQNDIDEVRQRLSSSSRTSLNQCDSSGYTPLHYSVRFQPADVCRLLLEHGANPNCQTRASLSTPLHRAVVFKNLEAIDHLLRHNADVTLKDIDGQTPIDKARTIDTNIADVLVRSQSSGWTCCTSFFSTDHAMTYQKALMMHRSARARERKSKRACGLSSNPSRSIITNKYALCLIHRCSMKGKRPPVCWCPLSTGSWWQYERSTLRICPEKAKRKIRMKWNCARITLW